LCENGAGMIERVGLDSPHSLASPLCDEFACGFRITAKLFPRHDHCGFIEVILIDEVTSAPDPELVGEALRVFRPIGTERRA
jgi:hypothetical protein